MEAFLDSDIEVLSYPGLSPADWGEKGGFHVEAFPVLGSHFFVINENNDKIRLDRRIRQAIRLFIDKRELLELFENKDVSKIRASRSLVSSHLKGYQACSSENFSELAQEERQRAIIGLLDAAGYSDQNPLQLKVIYQVSSQAEKMIAYLKEKMEETNLIQINPQALSPSDFINNLHRGRFDMAFVNHRSFLQDPEGFLGIYDSRSRVNYIHDDSILRDRAIKKARKALSRRMRAWKGVECGLLSSLYVLPMYESNRFLLNHVSFHDPDTNLYGLIDLRFLTFEEAVPAVTEQESLNSKVPQE